MYERHELLFEPDDDCVLWKYMSFSKFVNMLRGRMYFNRLDNFEDVFEGTYPQFNVAHRKDLYGEHIPPQDGYDAVERSMKKSLYVSCFHKSQYETAFMWKQYADDDGIAIKTTSERLKKSFHKTSKRIHISAVQYIDYDREFLPEGNCLYLATFKRKSFEPESEVRCIYWRPSGDDPYAVIPLGELIDIDLATLIDEIYISPYAASYIREDVELIVNKFNINTKVIQSKLLTLN